MQIFLSNIEYHETMIPYMEIAWIYVGYYGSLFNLILSKVKCFKHLAEDTVKVLCLWENCDENILKYGP